MAPKPTTNGEVQKGDLATTPVVLAMDDKKLTTVPQVDPVSPASSSSPAPPAAPNAPTTPAKPAELSTLSNHLKALLKRPGDFLLHLNKLLGPTEDITVVISTFYYVIRILGRFHAKFVSTLDKLEDITSYNASTRLSSATNFITQSGRLLWDTRMTLRLFRLLPIYSRLRNIIANRKSEGDRVMYVTSLLQCSLYGVSQLLENAAYLTERNIIPSGLTSALTRAPNGRSSAIYTLAYRTWFLAVTCDVLRMIRKVQLMWDRDHQQETTNDTKDKAIALTSEKWWPVEFLLPMAWYPIGWQLSGWFEDSNPGFNTRLHTAACVLSDVDRTSALWGASAWPDFKLPEMLSKSA